MRRKVDKPKRVAVARVAYELYLRRGREHGYDVEDWLEAERLLQEEFNRRASIVRRPRVARRMEDKSRL